MKEAIDPRHLIDEMRHDVSEMDERKALIVLAHLKQVDEEAQLAILAELAVGRPSFSLPLYARALVDEPSLEFTFPEIRQWMASLAAQSPEDLADAIGGTAGSVRAAVIATAVEVGMDGADGVLLNALNMESDPAVLSAVIEALGELGTDEVVNSVAEYLYVTDDDLFAAAARALARIGSPEAVTLLRQRMGIHPHLDEVIVGILWEVQTPESLNVLNQVLNAPRAEVRGAAKQALRMTGPKALPVLVNNLVSGDNDLLVNTLEILGDIGDEAVFRAVRHLLQRHPESPNVRFAAFEALGKLPGRAKGFALVSGLEDPVENVRIAAATAIEKNFDVALEGGIGNIMRSGRDMAFPVVRAVTDARCDTLVPALFGRFPEFREYFLEDVTARANPELCGHYAEVFRKHGMDEAVREILARSPKAEAAAKRVFAVDDSRMVLTIYKGVLSRLGFTPVLFDSPEAAVEAALADPPSAVLTDLNMPGISGVELIRRIRAVHSGDNLPVIMVTTQESGVDFAEAKDAGVNLIIKKPFTEVDIGRALVRAGVAP